MAEQVNPTGSVHTTASFSATIRDDVLIDATKWRNCKTMTLRVRIHTRAAVPGFRLYSTSRTGISKEIAKAGDCLSGLGRGARWG